MTITKGATEREVNELLRLIRSMLKDPSQRSKVFTAMREKWSIN